MILDAIVIMFDFFFYLWLGTRKMPTTRFRFTVYALSGILVYVASIVLLLAI